MGKAGKAAAVGAARALGGHRGPAAPQDLTGALEGPHLLRAQPGPTMPLARSLPAPPPGTGETGTGGPLGIGPGEAAAGKGGFLTRGRSLEIGKKRRLKLSATSTACSGGGGSSCGSGPRAPTVPAARLAVPRAAISSRCLSSPLPLPGPRRKQ